MMKLLIKGDLLSSDLYHLFSRLIVYNFRCRAREWPYKSAASARAAAVIFCAVISSRPLIALSRTFLMYVCLAYWVRVIGMESATVGFKNSRRKISRRFIKVSQSDVNA